MQFGQFPLFFMALDSFPFLAVKRRLKPVLLLLAIFKVIQLQPIRIIQLLIHLTNLSEGMFDYFRIICYFLIELFEFLLAEFRIGF